MTTCFTQQMQSFETIIDFLRFAISEAHRQGLFYGHGSDNALDDMRALILDRLSLPLDANEYLLQARLSAEEKTDLCVQLQRRIIDKIPVAYLTQNAYFCGLPFYVDERVLIPRSPIAEMIQQHFSPWLSEPTRILDLCTGSACIAIACAYAFPEALVDAVDLSSDALAVAAINCEQHSLSDRVHLIQSDCWENVPKTRYELIVSNPPYVGDEEMASLPAEYRHEPQLALRADDDGLAIVANILQHAHRYLTNDGILVVEVGNSADALWEKYPDLPFTWLDFEHGGEGVFLLTYHQLSTYFTDDESYERQ